MKKALSLVLAVVLVFGMTVTAFAAVPDAGDIVGDLVGYSSSTTTVVRGATVSVPSIRAAEGTATTDNGMGLGGSSLTVEDGSGNFGVTVEDSDGTDITDQFALVRVTFTNAVVGATGTTKASVNAVVTLKPIATATVMNDTVTVIVLEDGTGSAGSVSLTFGLEIVTGTTASSTDDIPTTWRITGIASNWSGTYDWGSTDWDALRGDMSIKSSALTADMFTWEARTTGTSYADVDLADYSGYASRTVKSSHLTNVTVRTSNTKNMGGTIDEIKIDGNKLKVTTVEYFMKCGKTEGYFDLALAYKGRTSGVKESIVFTIENEKEEIDEYWTYVDTDDHIYLEATETIRYLEMYSGNNLYVTRGMSKGQKIYCRSDITMSTADEKLFYEYAELDSVYTMRTIGVSAAGTTVQFKDLVDTYFVYDSNYKLIGTTADSKLPWSEKYYLATKKVDLGGAPAVDEAPADVEPTAPGVTDNEGLGGDEAPVVPNANYNPNTGL